MEGYEENEDEDRSKTSAGGLKVIVYHKMFEQKPHLYLFERRDKLTGSTVCHVDIASQEGLGEAGQESGVQQICLHEVYKKALHVLLIRHLTNLPSYFSSSNYVRVYRAHENHRTCTVAAPRESTNVYLDTSVSNTREAQ